MIGSLLAADTVTDELINSTIRSVFSSCTLLTIAHRLETIADADRILVLGDGQILEFGSPAQLLQLSVASSSSSSSSASSSSSGPDDRKQDKQQHEGVSSPREGEFRGIFSRLVDDAGASVRDKIVTLALTKSHALR